MLAEELFPEGETVDALPLQLLLALSVLIDECGSNALLTLDQTSGHEKPLESLDAHERVIVEDGQVFNLMLGIIKKTAGLPRHDIIHDFAAVIDAAIVV